MKRLLKLWGRWGPILGLVAALVLVAEQRTIGEASVFTYVSLSLPPVVWTGLMLLGSIAFLAGKRRLLSLLYLLAAVGTFPFLWDPSFGHYYSTALSDLRVMTFNIEKFRAFRPEEVAAAIRKANPDIVCLQEVAPLAAPRLIPREFHKALPGYRIIQRGETAIAVRSRYPVTFGGVFALRGGEGARPAQMVTAMIAGRPVCIIDVHMQYFPWDGSVSVSQASRNFMKEVASLEDLVREPGIPTLVAGDFNTVPHGRAHRMLRRYMKDCFAEAAGGFGYTLPATNPLRRLDYIYVSPDIKPLRAWVASTVASDHRAVVADIRFQP